MPDYSKGQVYKIVSNINDDVYIGSTCDGLKRRLANHVRLYKSYLKGGKRSSCSSYSIIEKGDYEIVLIEDYPCETKKHLEQRERYWIENTNCINKIVPTRTTKERNVITQYDKKWKQENKDKVKIYAEKSRAKIKANQPPKEKPPVQTPEQRAEYKARWFKENQERLQAKAAERRLANLDKDKEYKHKWYEAHKEEMEAKRRENKDEINARRRERYEQNKNAINARRREKALAEREQE
jgi:hypothetical protein